MTILQRFPSLAERHVTLAHGNGGRLMRELIERVFIAELGSAAPDAGVDAAGLSLADVAGAELVVSTDGFTVQPLEFPGGDIGSLAVHGTVNDLAVAGAQPRWLTLNVFVEEGFAIARLQAIAASIGRAARACRVTVVAGDTKVLERGNCDGLYLATTGVGFRPHGVRLSADSISAGDRILVSGGIGEHGAAVMLAREDFGLRGDLRSDAGSVLRQTQALLTVPGLRFMRDPTRGGLATVLHDIARGSGCGVRLDEADVPVADAVASVCELLGYDPLYLACEGRVVAVVAPEAADAALAALRAEASDAAIVGVVTDAWRDVVLSTALGGERVLDELEDDPLPRIC